MESVRPRIRPVDPETVYTGSWLAIKLGVGPRELDRRRRAGELVAYPAGRGTEWLYPAWQLDGAGRPLPQVAELVRAARAAGLSDEQLAERMLRRDGLTGTTRLADLFRSGRSDRVIASIRGR